MDTAAVADNRWRTVLLATIVAAGAVLFFWLAYLSIRAFLPPNGSNWTLCVWDCGWYRTIAEYGYAQTPKPDNLQANFGFFPAFPLGVYLVMHAAGLDFLSAGLVLNALLLLLFCWVVLSNRHELALKDRGDALVFLTAFVLSPWSLYNRVPYTEMLFNLSALCTFLCWRRGNYAAAAAWGVLLTATRLTGILLPVILLVELLFGERKYLVELLARPDWRIRALAVMPLGLVAFVVYLYVRVGDPLAYFHIQEFGWSQGLRNPLAVLMAGITTGLVDQYGVLALAVASAAALWGLRLRRIPSPLAAFAWLVPSCAFASVLFGEARYALALFPIYLVVPALPRRGQIMLFTIFAMGQIVFVYYWIHREQMLQ
jgi:hypothetical protein